MSPVIEDRIFKHIPAGNSQYPEKRDYPRYLSGIKSARGIERVI